MMRRAANTLQGRDAAARSDGAPMSCVASARRTEAPRPTAVSSPRRGGILALVTPQEAWAVAGLVSRGCQPVSGDLQAICQRPVEGIAP